MRPEDIPLLDRAILEPIIEKAASEMAEAYPEQSIEEWIEDLQLALLKGDVLIVIDDRKQADRIGPLGPPPFLGLVTSSAAPGGVGLGGSRSATILSGSNGGRANLRPRRRNKKKGMVGEVHRVSSSLRTRPGGAYGII